MNSRTVLMLLCATLALSGCDASTSAFPHADRSVTPVNGEVYVLAEEPKGAIGVIEAREAGEDGQPMVLVGRVGGAANPWIEGRAAFMLLDPSVEVVDESAGMAEGKLCTADCCATERLACTTLVKVVDSAGALVTIDARDLLGLKEDDMVVVEGMAKRDTSGNFLMLATGVHIRK